MRIFSKRRMGRRGISPLIATVLLVAFAVALGAVVMSWAKGVESSDHGSEEIHAEGGECLVPTMPADPLQQLQVSYIQGKISKETYLQKEQELIS